MQTLTVADVSYEQLAATIDHSLLRPELTLDEVVAGCQLAGRYEVKSVCVRPADVSLAAEALAASPVEVGTVIGFPHGSSTTATKVFEANLAMEEGATALDLVLNIGWLRSHDYEPVEEEIRRVVEAAGDRALVKVILENAYLDEEEKRRGSRLVESAGAAF